MARISRKGFELSFNMLVSIIVIVAVLAVAFYAIQHFLTLKNCTELGLYGRGLQERVDDMWNGDSGNELFGMALPGSVERVCFGDLTSDKAKQEPEYESLKVFQSRDANMFYYPPSSCDLRYIKIDNVNPSEFWCARVKNGKISVRLTKGSYDALVSVCDSAYASCPEANRVPASTTNTNGGAITETNTNNPYFMTQTRCTNAAAGGLCDALGIAFDDESHSNEYKAYCCSRYTLCCA